MYGEVAKKLPTDMTGVDFDIDVALCEFSHSFENVGFWRNCRHCGWLSVIYLRASYCENLTSS